MSSVLFPRDPRISEDCLTLDVFVPEKIFSKSKKTTRPSNSTGGAPVMVWIYGGGYVEGSKDGNGVYYPAGLIKASQVGDSEGIIFVAPNYRVSFFVAIDRTMLTGFIYLARCFWVASRPYSLLKRHSKCCTV